MKTFHTYLPTEQKLYACSRCRIHLATQNELISKTFYVHRGKAYFFKKVTNVKIGKPEERLLRTGVYSVGDVACANCAVILGWFYYSAEDIGQKHKVGKFVIELKFLIKLNNWDTLDDEVVPYRRSPTVSESSTTTNTSSKSVQSKKSSNNINYLSDTNGGQSTNRRKRLSWKTFRFVPHVFRWRSNSESSLTSSTVQTTTTASSSTTVTLRMSSINNMQPSSTTTVQMIPLRNFQLLSSAAS
ncbi:hypothetical protein SNEBB_004705 [Seison nebaliae]|nr:hypothetical protein SNEBB_004705 [Seison nebaliae]